MLLDLIARYYKFLWLALAAVAFIKVILSNLFQEDLAGVNGIIFALFKWYGEDEQEMEDTRRRRTMRIHNVITLFIYFILIVILVATLLPLLLG